MIEHARRYNGARVTALQQRAHAFGCRFGRAFVFARPRNFDRRSAKMLAVADHACDEPNVYSACNERGKNGRPIAFDAAGIVNAIAEKGKSFAHTLRDTAASAILSW
jgi:hypothetical protein